MAEGKRLVPLLQWTRGMCSDAASHEAIDIKLAEAVQLAKQHEAALARLENRVIELSGALRELAKLAETADGRFALAVEDIVKETIHPL